MGKGGGGSTAQPNVPTTTQSSPNPIAQQAYTDLLNRSTNVANTPLQQYGGNLVQGFNDTQNQAFANVNQKTASSQPYTNQAASMVYNAAQPTLGQIPGATQSLMNPYMQNAVGATSAQMQNLFGQQQNQLTGQAIGAGAYGGDRAGVAAGNLANQQALAYGQTIGGMENQGYQAAQSAALNSLSSDAWRQANAGMELQGMGQQNLQNQLTTGGMQQQLGQEQLNIPYEQFVQQQAYPFQTTGWLSNIAEGLGSQMGGTSASWATGPNPISQVAGLGVAGLGAAGAAGAFGSARGGRIERQDAGRVSSDGYRVYLADGVPHIVSPVKEGAPTGLGHGAPDAKIDTSRTGSGASGAPSPDAVAGLGKGLKDMFKKDKATDAQLKYLQEQSAAGGDGGLSAAANDEANYMAATNDYATTGVDSGWGTSVPDVSYYDYQRGGRLHRRDAGSVPNVDVDPTGGGAGLDAKSATPPTSHGASGGHGGPGGPSGFDNFMKVGNLSKDAYKLGSKAADWLGGAGDAGLAGIDAAGGTDAAAAAGQAAIDEAAAAAAEELAMEEVAVIALANRGGRMHRAEGGLATIDMPAPITVPNPKGKIFYGGPGYVPGPGATFGQDIGYTPIPMPAAPDYGSTHIDSPTEIYAPGGVGVGPAARGGAIRGRYATQGSVDPSGLSQDALARPDLAMMAASPLQQQKAGKYANATADQLASWLTAVPPDSAVGQQIASALQTKRMLPSYSPPQAGGIMPGANAAQPPPQVSLATGLPETAAFGGAVSPSSYGQGFAGGGLVPTMRGAIPMRDDYDEPHPWDGDEANAGSLWAGHLNRTRPAREPGDWGMLRVPGYVGKDAEIRSGDNVADRFDTRPTRPRARDHLAHAAGGAALHFAPRRDARGDQPADSDEFDNHPLGSRIGQGRPDKYMTTPVVGLDLGGPLEPENAFNRPGRFEDNWDADDDLDQRMRQESRYMRHARGGLVPHMASGGISDATREILADRDEVAPSLDVDNAPSTWQRNPAPEQEVVRGRIPWGSSWARHPSSTRPEPVVEAARAPSAAPVIAMSPAERAPDISQATRDILDARDNEPSPPAATPRAVHALPTRDQSDMSPATRAILQEHENPEDGGRRPTPQRIQALRRGEIMFPPLRAAARDVFGLGDGPPVVGSAEPGGAGSGLSGGAGEYRESALAEPGRAGSAFDDTTVAGPVPAPAAAAPVVARPGAPAPAGRPGLAATPPAGAVVVAPKVAGAPGAAVAAPGSRVAAAPAARPGLAAGPPAAALPVAGAPPAAAAPGATAGATAAGPPVAKPRDRYDDLIASLAYKPTPYEAPKRDPMGNFWSAVMAGGLGMAASQNPTAMGGIGEGGLRGLSAFSRAQQQDETAEESAKKLHGETERWNKQFAHNQQETVRKTASDESKERRDEAARATANLHEQQRHAEKLASDATTRAHFEAMAARGQQQHHQLTAGKGVDENGNTVDGAYVFNPNTGATDFRPGVVLSGRSSAKQFQEQEMIKGYQRDLGMTAQEATDYYHTQKFSPQTQAKMIGTEKKIIKDGPDGYKISDAEAEKQATETVRRRMAAVQEQRRAAGPVAPAPSSGAPAAVPLPDEAVAILKSNPTPGRRAQFNATFGEGAAQRALGE